MRFIVRLKSAHDEAGMSPYQVSKKTGVAINTVVRYTEADEVEVGQLSTAVVQLAKFYGVDWRDGQIVEAVEDTDEEIKNALPAAS